LECGPTCCLLLLRFLQCSGAAPYKSVATTDWNVDPRVACCFCSFYNVQGRPHTNLSPRWIGMRTHVLLAAFAVFTMFRGGPIQICRHDGLQCEPTCCLLLLQFLPCSRAAPYKSIATMDYNADPRVPCCFCCFLQCSRAAPLDRCRVAPKKNPENIKIY